ncbi:DUF2232 domain-containing protein [Heliorestis acidaminivorans]|uniref:DUF2232 domain-containing protein n=1 Tax=Heliorestis acidaminivorans TaxID=553427 RepID=A0A6I0EZC9_9FIRM|nr:DUF2232 domain-containing protein [Heliorestis acidaminivorans]KAB2953866.1 DUF2232 domain-containing protein [Heliorestis acidaminivorans]
MPTRTIVESTLLAIVTALLAILGIIFLPISPLISLFWTVPIVVVVVRHDWNAAIYTLSLSTALIAVFLGPMPALMIFLLYGVLAIAYGYAFRHLWTTFRTALLGMAVSILTTALFVLAGVYLTGFSLADLEAQVALSVEEVIEFYRTSGLIEQYEQQGITEEVMRELFTDFLRLVKNMLPSILIIYSSFVALMNLLLARWVIRKLTLPAPALSSFKEWRLPWHFVWVVITALATLLAGDYWDIDWLYLLGLNILYVIYPVLLILGLSLLFYILERIPSAPFIWVFLTFFTLMFFKGMMIFLATLAVFDLLFDYRDSFDKYMDSKN